MSLELAAPSYDLLVVPHDVVAVDQRSVVFQRPVVVFGIFDRSL